MVDPKIRVGVDVGCKAHRVGIAGPSGSILEEFAIPHSHEGFQEFFHRIERHRRDLNLSVAVVMEGFNGYGRPLDRLIQERGYTLYNVNNLKLARFKQIFSGAAKTDRLDTRKILELFHLKDQLPLAKDVLQEVPEVPPENERLKRLSRRRRELVDEKVRVVNRMQADLQAVCPELLATTNDADNLRFLRFLSCRNDLPKLARMGKKSVLGIRGIGKEYAGIIGEWQRRASFSPEVEYVGPMSVSDARRTWSCWGRSPPWTRRWSAWPRSPWSEEGRGGGCVKSRQAEGNPSGMLQQAKQGGDVRARWFWAEPTVWTERMLTALETG